MLTVFVNLTQDNVLIGDRCYPATSVVEVEENQAAYLVKERVALPHDGPAFEPEPIPDPVDGSPAKGRRK
jgi:hypothetical protein